MTPCRTWIALALGLLGCATGEASLTVVGADAGRRADGGAGTCTPGPERCNGADDDCDGVVDEGLVRACGEAAGTCEPGTERCAAGAWVDCDAIGGGEELCEGPEDEDCDGTADEGCACADGQSRPCGSGEGACTPGEQRCEGSVWGACVGGTRPGAESCDGADEDCDGTVDEGLARPCGSNSGACREGVERCVAGGWGACEGEVGPVEESCAEGGDEDCDGRTDEGCSCVDGDERPCGSEVGACEPGVLRCVGGAWGECAGAVGPAPERCDGALDEDCDGQTDEGCRCVDGTERTCGTGVGACVEGVQRCAEGRWDRCDGAVDPGAERCDGGTDEDCDGAADEGCDCVEGAEQACGSDVGRCQTGVQRCAGGAWGACAGGTGPEVERCDGAADEDCDGAADEGCECANGAERPCGLEVGACRAGTQRCAGGEWGVCAGQVGPEVEVCDGRVDEDCDGAADEGCDCVDGTERPCGSDVGACEQGAERCSGGRWGACQGAVEPGVEVCEGVEDENCDGETDEGCECINDAERACGSDVGACREGTERCAEGRWGACEGSVGPAVEGCGRGQDEDCDGEVDEGFRAEVRRLSWDALGARHPECNAAHGFGPHCASAFHRDCAEEGCTDAGWGPLQSFAADASGVCVAASRQVHPTWADINPGFQICTQANAFNLICMIYANQYCQGLGHEGGFGPVEYDVDGPWLVCVDRPQATIEATTWQTLSQQVAACDGQNQLWGAQCALAVHRYCRAQGAVSGAGPVGFDGDNLAVLCFRR